MDWDLSTPWCIAFAAYDLLVGVHGLSVRTGSESMTGRLQATGIVVVIVLCRFALVRPLRHVSFVLTALSIVFVTYVLTRMLEVNQWRTLAYGDYEELSQYAAICVVVVGALIAVALVLQTLVLVITRTKDRGARRDLDRPPVT